MYHDISATWAIASDLSLVGHIGLTDVKAMFGSLNPDYSDYRVALSKTYAGGWNASAAVVGAS